MNKKIEELISFGKEFWASQDMSNPAMRDKKEHVDRVVALAKEENSNLLTACALFHDIGRVPQLELLGGFKDGVVLHHHLGLNLFEQWLYKGMIESSEWTDIISQVITYHGRQKFMPEFVSGLTKDIVNIISNFDNIDNGCVGAVGYLDRETDDDVKDYIKNNPELDQKRVSPKVLEFYTKGEKFDKLKYCKTYADYILFAIVLAINSLKGEYAATAVKAMSMPCTDSYGNTYENVLEGYKAILSRRISTSLVETCYEVLEEAYNKAAKEAK